MMERQVHRRETVVLLKKPSHRAFRAAGLSLHDARCKANWDRSLESKSDNFAPDNRRSMLNSTHFYGHPTPSSGTSPRLLIWKVSM